jgi:hypothetical protein
MNELQRMKKLACEWMYRVKSIKFRAIECAMEHFWAAAQETGESLFFTCNFHCMIYYANCGSRVKGRKSEKVHGMKDCLRQERRRKKDIACSWIVRLLATACASFHLKWNKFKLRLLRATVHSGIKFFRAMCRLLHPVESEGPFKVGPLVFETHIDSLSS